MLYTAKELPSTTINSARVIHSNENVYEISEFHAYIYDAIAKTEGISEESLLAILHKDEINIGVEGSTQDGTGTLEDLLSTTLQDLQDIGALESKEA